MTNYNTDFSPSLIAATRLTKDAHSSFISGKYDEAVSKGMEALVELRLAVVAMKAVAEANNLKD